MACGTSAVSGASGRERENLLVRARLSPEEREILDRFERRELPPSADVERELEAARQAVRNTPNRTRRANSGRPVENAPTNR